jgi:hypothetical protein
VSALVQALRTWRLVGDGGVAAKPDAGSSSAHSASLPRLCASSPILDLAAGSGEMTLALRAIGFTHVTGCDPYTQAAFAERVGYPAESWSFQDVANGELGGASHAAAPPLALAVLL